MSPNTSNSMVYEGQLGRTSQTSVLVTSQTGTAFPASVYTTINVTQDPELRDELMSGTLNLIDCPFTSTTYELAVPVLYHDEKKRLFVLVLPPSLRHREMEERSRVLEELSRDSENVPGYARDFRTVFDPAELDSLSQGEARTAARPPAAPAEPPPSVREPDLEEERLALKKQREALEIEREQLDEVRGRFDREKKRMDEFEAGLKQERDEIDRARRELEKRRKQMEADFLNLEQKQIRADSGQPESASEESTQVVTDDQFIEVVEESEADEELLAQISEAVEEIESEVEESTPAGFSITARTAGVPTKFKNVVAGDRKRAIKIVDDHILAVQKLDGDRIKSLFDGEVSFFVQSHEIEKYPVIALLLARLDENDKPVESVGWTLDLADDGDRILLDRLSEIVDLRVGLYAEDENLIRAVDVKAPLAENVRWIRENAEEQLKSARSAGTTFEDAREAFHSDDFERLGSMRHSFERDSFRTADTPSEVKLAAGIVGYWSTPSQHRYLIENRSFPLEHFREIQERVARKAAEFGIYLEEPLRDVAVELGLATDEPAVIDLLMANFAEVCVSIRKNDLDPLQQWENWDALLTAGEKLGVPPDPDVVELADVSLKRAREFQELEDLSGPGDDERSGDAARDDGKTVVEVDSTLVVARRS